MNIDSRTDGARALDRWMEIQGELLRGVAHAMSNRIGTLSAGLFLLEGNGGNGDNGNAVGALRAEVDQLEALLLQLRMLPRAPVTLEPMLASDIARNAIELHGHHGDLRHVECILDDPGTIPPLRADPQALLHALLVAITAAKQAATARTVTLRLGASDETVTLDATAGDETIADTRFALEALAATELLAASPGVTVHAHRDGCRIEVPTLAASRRRA